MKTTPINYITAKQAHNMGVTEIHMALQGLGDQILFLAALEQYYKKTNEKLFVVCQYKELFCNVDFCWILDSYNGEEIEKLYTKQTRANKNYATNTIMLEGIEFTLKFILSFNFTCNKKGKLITHWPEKHLLARMCERLGLSGEIEIAPRIHFDNDEREYGRFSKKRQIAIMAGGRFYYKYFSPTIAQKIVDALHSEYDFVQIGGKNDPPLTHTLNLLGMSFRSTAAVLSNSDLFVGPIGGQMHLARASNCPAVIAYSGEPLVYEQYICNSYVFSDTPCDECPQSRLDPAYDSCPHQYRCIINIDPEKMIATIRDRISFPSVSFPSVSFPPQVETLTPAPASGMESWHRLRFAIAQRLPKGEEGTSWKNLPGFIR